MVVVWSKKSLWPDEDGAGSVPELGLTTAKLAISKRAAVPISPGMILRKRIDITTSRELQTVIDRDVEVIILDGFDLTRHGVPN